MRVSVSYTKHQSCVQGLDLLIKDTPTELLEQKFRDQHHSTFLRNQPLKYAG